MLEVLAHCLCTPAHQITLPTCTAFVGIIARCEHVSTAWLTQLVQVCRTSKWKSYGYHVCHEDNLLHESSSRSVFSTLCKRLSWLPGLLRYVFGVLLASLLLMFGWMATAQHTHLFAARCAPDDIQMSVCTTLITCQQWFVLPEPMQGARLSHTQAHVYEVVCAQATQGSAGCMHSLGHIVLYMAFVCLWKCYNSLQTRSQSAQCETQHVELMCSHWTQLTGRQGDLKVRSKSFLLCQNLWWACSSMLWLSTTAFFFTRRLPKASPLLAARLLALVGRCLLVCLGE